MGRLHNEEFKHEAVRMGWQHLDNDLISVAQYKTNAKLIVCVAIQDQIAIVIAQRKKLRLGRSRIL